MTRGNRKFVPSVGGSFSLEARGLLSTVVGPALIYDGNVVSARINDVVGDKFQLTPRAPSWETLSSVDWSFININHLTVDVYAGQTVNLTDGWVNQPLGQTLYGYDTVVNGVAPDPITAYWGPYPGTEIVSATFHYADGTSYRLFASVNIVEPVGVITVGNLGTTSLTNHEGSAWISSGTDVNRDPGISWAAWINPATTNGITAGNYGVVQTVARADVLTIYTTAIGNTWERDWFRDADGTNRLPLLDDRSQDTGINHFFYGGDIQAVDSDLTLISGDTPELPVNPAGLLGGDIIARVDEVFVDTLMYQPNGPMGNGIYVPLGKMSWGWTGSWDITTPDVLNAAVNPHVIDEYASTVIYPTWNGAGTYYSDPTNPIYFEHRLN